MIQTETSRVRDHLETVLKRRSEQRALILVEDDSFWIDSAQTIIGKFDCILDVAQDAETALAMLRNSEWNYKAVFIDQGLPKMSGMQMLKIITNERPKMFCVVVTGFIDEALALSCAECGVALIRKPITIEVIRPILARLGINEKAT